jgi:hypothetical protein
MGCAFVDSHNYRDGGGRIFCPMRPSAPKTARVAHIDWGYTLKEIAGNWGIHYEQQDVSIGGR